MLHCEEKLAATLAIVDKKKEEYEELYNNATKLSSELEENINIVEDWDAKTVGLREIFDNSKTAICNNVLLWISIQLDTTTETMMYKKAKEQFLDEEIEIAKDILFDVCGGADTAIGPKETRRGGRKEPKKEKDCKDIIEALKTLRADATEPLMVSTKSGIMQCPTIIPISNNIKDEPVILKINELESVMNTFLKEQQKYNDLTYNSLEALRKNCKIEGVVSRLNELESSLETLLSEYQ